MGTAYLENGIDIILNLPSHTSLTHNRQSGAHLEHFIEYRQIVRDQIEAQLAEIVVKAANVDTQTVLVS